MILRKIITSHIFSCLLILALSVNNGIYAQSPMPIQPGSPYFCGFEDPQENQYWVFENGASSNQWTIGTEEKNLGDYGLYVTYDNNGVRNAGTSDNKNYICAYRTFDLTPGTVYDVSFDWKNPGYGKGEMYVLVVPDSEVIEWSRLSDNIPTWVKTYMRFENRDSIMTDSPIWQNRSITITGINEPVKLVFYWVNTSESRHPGGKMVAAGCLDNIQLGTKYDCPKPTNLKYNQTDMGLGQFSWNGGFGPFEIMYKGINDDEWGFINVQEDNLEAYIQILQKGSYMVAIRSICDNDTSIWAVFNLLVHYSNDNCLDFLELEGPNIITYTGDFDNPYKYQGKPVDYGFSSIASRHTIHYLADEYDARTNYKLKTLPPDGMPSVRLGNWAVGAQAEAIQYTYTVSEDAPLLLIKYAIVLQDPDHVESNQPSFKVKITDKLGQDISDMCGNANFIAKKDAPGWVEAAGTGTEVVIYKDWTSAGLNLTGLVGEEISIRFETKDCEQEGHFGYAYFTLDCMGAKISGIGCGDKMLGKIDAPEGFRYKWYPKGDSAYMYQPNYGDTLQTFLPPDGADDTGTYICRVISKENPTCWFELEANLDPRDVYIDVKPEPIYEDCKAKIHFDNQSYTLTRKMGLKGECEVFEWDFGNGKTSFYKSPTIEFEPNETYTVKLRASISDGQCFGEWEQEITIPDFGHTDDTLFIQKCTADPYYTFEGKVYSKTTTVSEHFTSIYGCDSIRTLNLVIADEYKDSVVLKITNEDDYYFYGDKVEQTGIYRHFSEGVGNDCDSVFILNLTVDTILRVDIYLPDICSDPDYPSFSINYQQRIGEIIEYSLVFGEKAKEAGFVDLIKETHLDGEMEVDLPVNIRPDYYDAQLIFYGGEYRNDTIDLVIPVYYSAKILEQKWNDVIAVTNSSINGGYEFSEYSWYLEMVEISGFHKSYIYLPPALEFGLQYRAKLTRVDDGVSIFTCPLEPERKPADSEISIYPTITARGSVIKVNMTAEQGEGAIWDVMGNHISDIKLQSETQFNAPDKKGIYLLKITTEESEPNIFRIIVN